MNTVEPLLVASAPMRDLLLRAKHLLIAAMVAGSGGLPAREPEASQSHATGSLNRSQKLALSAWKAGRQPFRKTLIHFSSTKPDLRQYDSPRGYQEVPAVIGFPGTARAR